MVVPIFCRNILTLASHLLDTAAAGLLIIKCCSEGPSSALRVLEVACRVQVGRDPERLQAADQWHHRGLFERVSAANRFTPPGPLRRTSPCGGDNERLLISSPAPISFPPPNDLLLA